MQKKLIALAIAGVIAAPAAMAADSSVTIYGQLDMSIDMADHDAAAGDSETHGINSNNSRIGFKGKEDLGNGMFASWQIEQTIGMDGTGGNTFATRNTYVGLGGAFGEVRLGNHDTPHKMSTAKLDIFADTNGDYNNIVGTVNTNVIMDERAKDTIAYLSPNFSGFSAAVAYSAGNNEALGNDRTSTTSLGLMYENGPIYVGYGYERHNNEGSVVALSETTGNKLGVGFAGDGFKVGLIYDKISESGADTINDRAAWYLNGQINAGPGAVKLAYGKANDAKGNADTGATSWTVGYDYPMSKRTKLYALYQKVDNDAAAAYGVATSQGGAAAPAAGRDPSIWSFGVRHSF